MNAKTPKPKSKKGKKPTVRRPVQARGIATVEVLLEAAARVLSKEEFERFTTNRVAKVAGVGIGSLYDYFPDKQELLAQLTIRLAAEIESKMTTVLRAQDGVGIGQALHASLVVVVEIYRSRAELLSKLIGHAPFLPRPNPLDLTEKSVREAMADMLRSHVNEIIVEDYDVAAINLCRICRGMVESAASDPFMPLDLATVVAELAVIGRRYLTGKP